MHPNELNKAETMPDQTCAMPGGDGQAVTHRHCSSMPTNENISAPDCCDYCNQCNMTIHSEDQSVMSECNDARDIGWVLMPQADLGVKVEDGGQLWNVKLTA
jgi:hypothetical protein